MASPPRRRVRRWPHALAMLAYLGLAIGLPWAAGWALLHHPQALPLLLRLAPGVQAEGVSGTLGDGHLHIARLQVQLPADGGRLAIDRLTLDGLSLRRTPHAQAWARLQWQDLHLGRLVWTSGPPSGQPPTLPDSLRLPLAADRLLLRVDELQVDSAPPVTALVAQLSLGADEGRQHRLDGLRLQVDGLLLQARAALDSDAPQTLQAGLLAQPVAPAATWQARLALHGPLRQLHGQAALRGLKLPGAPATGAPLALDARATLAPLAAWPLQALDLDTRGLDLAALRTGLPHTLIDGQAQVHTQGLDRPARVQLNLRNQRPGTWDQQKLPLRQLQLDLLGDPRQRDRLTLLRFDLQLADDTQAAGRAQGSGHWLGDTLELKLALDGLLPAHLHHQAAALEISGPLTLKLSGLPNPGTSNTSSTSSGSTSSGSTSSGSAGSASSPGTAPSASPPGRPAPPRNAASPRLALDARLAGRALDGTGLPVTLLLQAEASAGHLQVHQAQAVAGSAEAQLQLDARQQGADAWQLRGKARLQRFDPLPWWRGGAGTVWRRGPHRLNAELEADLLWHGAPQQGLLLDQLLLAADGNAHLHLADSLLAGTPMAADWRLSNGATGVRLETRTDVAGNTLTLDGQRGQQADDDRWQLQASLGALPALAPLRQLVGELLPAALPWWPTQGQAQATLQVRGRWPLLRTEGTLGARDLVAPAVQLARADARWKTGERAEAPLVLDLDARALHLNGQTLDRLQADVSGNLRQHALHLQVDSPVKPPAWTESVLGPAGSGTRLELRAAGSWTPEGDGGRWRVRELQLRGGARDAQGGTRPWLAADGLSSELRLDAQARPSFVELAPGRLQLLSTALNWSEARWQAGNPAQLDLVGELETIDVAAWLARAQPRVGWGGTLKVGGHFELHDAAEFDADVVLERLSGDLTLTDDLGAVQALGLSDITFRLSAHQGLWQVAQGFAGSSLGVISGAQVLRPAAAQRFPQAETPLDGVLSINVGNLGIWSSWVPPGWRLAGQLRTTAALGGTLGAPQLRGEMAGRELVVRNVLEGVNLTEGDLLATLGGTEAKIDHFTFKGGDGKLTLTGGATLGSQPTLTLHGVAERFRLLGRIDRRLVVSGKTTVTVDPQRLSAEGQLSVDEGLIDIGQASAPALDGDVKVHRPDAPAAAPEAEQDAPLPAPLRNARVQLAINLGDRLRLQGRGLDTLLRGQLQLRTPEGKVALHGTIRADGGTYAAYGQQLELQRSEVVFSGPTDNPRLDILAIRPNLDTIVGAVITGTAQNPRVRLYSEPDMTEYEKLSWLVLGRSPDGLGRADTALLQRAALALLAGEGKGPTDELFGALGITDFSLRQTDGTVRDTVVSLGKQLSRRWYVGYERSVNATTGTWQLVYRLAQRFTLRAQSGAENALDAIWSWRW